MGQPPSYANPSLNVARDALARTAAKLADLGWHVQIHTTLSVATTLAPALRDCPVPAVIDHFALARAVAGTGQPGLYALQEMVATAMSSLILIENAARVYDF